MGTSSTTVNKSTHTANRSTDQYFGSAGDPYAPELGNRGYDVQHYTIQLTLDPEDKFVKGTTSLNVISTKDGLDQIWLDFFGYTIENVLLNGEDILYKRSGPKLILFPRKPIADGENTDLKIHYQGTPPQQSSEYVPFIPNLGLIYTNQQDVFALGEPDGGRNWFPCNDHPRDKATFRFELTVPKGLTGIANGRLVEIQKGIRVNFKNSSFGDRYVWEHSYPLAAALASVIVGNYSLLEDLSPHGIRIRNYVNPAQQEAFAQQSAKIGPMLDWMSKRFGSYPFDEFGYVTVPEMRSSLEAQTIVILSDKNINENVMAHEMAHMWFGDWVGLDSWGEMWRNEGFATYVAQMWLHRDDPKGLNTVIEQYHLMINSQPSDYPLNNPPHNQLFGRDSYIKGAVFIHELRKTMGDKAFFLGLRRYFTIYGGSTASDIQFQAIMEKAAGKSLDKLFHHWLNEE